jgi:hypothetical protein
MKANELRIGNLVKRGDDTCVVSLVCRSHFNACNLESGVDYGNSHQSNYQPIPLTEEWLLKFKFENSKTRNWNRYFKEGIYPRSFAFQFFKNGRVDFWYSDFNLGKINDLKYNPVKYVHQLQNLYFQLTGEEILR